MPAKSLKLLVGAIEFKLLSPYDLQSTLDFRLKKNYKHLFINIVLLFSINMGLSI